MKRFVLAVLKILGFPALSFAIMVMMDIWWTPAWLTGDVALWVMGIALVLGIVSVIHSGKRERQKRKTVWRQEIHVESTLPYEEDSFYDSDTDRTPNPENRRNVRAGVGNREMHQTRKRQNSGRYRKKRHRLTPVIPVLVVAVVAFFLVVIRKNITHFNPSIPENVIEFGEKYPEADGFVRNFNRYRDQEFDMDVTKEMEDSDIPLFIQWDKRWGYRDYGGNYIGVAGCGPTCIAMVACGLEQNASINPYEVARYAAKQGYYTYGEGTSWSLMTEGAEHFGLKASGGTVSEDYILENLSESTPMICSMSPGDFTYTGHFIVLAGIDEEGRIIVNDPNSPKNSEKTWKVETLVSQMKGIWKYSL